MRKVVLAAAAIRLHQVIELLLAYLPEWKVFGPLGLITVNAPPFTLTSARAVQLPALMLFASPATLD
jgi:hypothetical protein